MENKQHLESLNPQKSQKFYDFIEEIESNGWEVIITQSYRSIATQNRLHRENSKNSIGGISAHNYGFALDINAKKGNVHLKKSSSYQDWVNSEIPKIAKKYELRWGGDFKNYYDPIHFDCVLPGYTSKWYDYLVTTYPTNFEEINTNRINWKFYDL